MKNSIVRIKKIELTNFKNVENGTIELKNNVKGIEEYSPTAEIIGIYGQNGSGKTALVNACKFLKYILEGEALPKDAYHYIHIFENRANLRFEFYINSKQMEYLVNYEITLEKTKNEQVRIYKEKLSYSKKEEKWTSRVTLLDYDISYEEVFKPKSKFNEIVSKDKENIINLRVAKKLALEKNVSFIFNEEVKDILSTAQYDAEYIQIVEELTEFARYNLFVIMNERMGILNMNILMPFSFRLEQEGGVTSGDIAVGLGEVSVVSKPVLDILNKIIEQMNIVLQYIVPTLKMELYHYGEQYDEKGELREKVQLLSVKGEAKLPIQYESEGIKKIISILSALIAMYNNPSICMVVDELDSGIYEFLLGEILKIIERGGKGQLFFTSHNLRPLEVIHKDCLYFTTTNPKNRYIRFANVKSNNNLRSLYIRSINLGGQKEELYNETNSLDIQRAFRLAGEKYNAI